MRKSIKIVALIIALCVNLGCNEAKSNISEQERKAQLERTLQENNITGEILEVKEATSGLLLVSISVEGLEVPFLATSEGKFIFQPEMMLSQDKRTREMIKDFYEKAQKKQEAKTASALKEIFKKHEKSAFVFKAQKPTNKVVYIVSDANCPYCQKEFDKIEKRTKNATVKMFVVGFLGKDSESKAAYALENKSGDSKRDMAMLKELYNPNTKGKAKDINLASELTEEIISIGVRQVPYIVESNAN